MGPHMLPEVVLVVECLVTEATSKAIPNTAWHTHNSTIILEGSAVKVSERMLPPLPLDQLYHYLFFVVIVLFFLREPTIYNFTEMYSCTYTQWLYSSQLYLF